MTRRCLFFFCGLLLFALVAPITSQDIKSDLVAPTEPLSPEDEKKGFILPPGFEAQLVAAEPDIAKPLNIAFDDRGRLWVTDTLEYPWAAPADRKGRDSVKVLSDFGPDGRARKIVTFADGLNIPIGVLPMGDSALVHSIPYVWKMTDTNGDGKADERLILLDRFGFDDTHGMTNAFTLGFDGWVYACHGFRNDSTVKARDGSVIKMNSGNVYRFKPDGTHIEQFTWGQVNPFGLALDPLGYLYSADCHSLPIYQLIRGAVYPSFSKPHDGLGFGPTVMQHLHHSTGIAGIALYHADQFPEQFRGTVFVGNVVTSRINHDRFEWNGSSPVAKELKDFLISKDQWFRPVDIKLGPDGALYVADFYNCIIGHYEVDLKHPRRDRQRGRIWRIVYRGEDGKKDPPKAPRADWSKASIKELIEDLKNANLTVRMFATHQLVQRGKDAIDSVKELLKPASSATQRAHALWVLERLGALEDAALAEACKDRESLVRVHALRILGERAKWSEEQRLLVAKAVWDEDPHVRRAATEAMGLHPDKRNIEVFFEKSFKGKRLDTHFDHVRLIALRNHLRDLKPWPLEGKTDREWATAALGIRSVESARYVLRSEVGGKRGFRSMDPYVYHVARYGDDNVAAEQIRIMREKTKSYLLGEMRVLSAIERGLLDRGARLSEEGRQWGAELTPKLLEAKDTGLIDGGLALAGSLRLSNHQERIQKLLLAPDTVESSRVAAIDALLAIDAGKNLATIGTALSQAHEQFRVQQHGANALARLNSADARAQLLLVLQTAPANVQTAYGLALAGSREGAESLLAAVENGKAPARLLQDRGVEGKLKESRLPDIEKRIAKLTEGLPPADQRLFDLIKARKAAYRAAKPELERGRLVFEKNCAICHQLGGKGAKFGPQLDGIGARGLDRILEDTLDPNRNIDQAFKATRLDLKDGKSVTGLFLREEGGQYVLADSQGKEVRVARKDVDERLISTLSAMPANAAEIIPEADFNHLLAFLLSQTRKEK